MRGSAVRYLVLAEHARRFLSSSSAGVDLRQVIERNNTRRCTDYTATAHLGGVIHRHEMWECQFIIHKGTARHRRAIERRWDEIGDDLEHSLFSRPEDPVQRSRAIFRGPEWTEEERDAVEELEIGEEDDEEDEGQEGEAKYDRTGSASW